MNEERLRKIIHQYRLGGLSYSSVIGQHLAENDDIADMLEKHLPKHIEKHTEDDREFIDYVCPNCKTTLQQKMKSATRTTIFKYKHCIECGQALDWTAHPTEKGDEADA